MADPSKTEPGTPKRRQEARGAGQVARSTEINSFAVLLFGLTALKITAHKTFQNLQNIMKFNLGHMGQMHFDEKTFIHFFLSVVLQALTILAPTLACVALGGIIAGVGQAGLRFSTRVLSPSFAKLNPANGLKKVFGNRGFVEVIKSFVKIAVIVTIAYLTIRNRFGQLFLLPTLDLKEGLLLVSDIVVQLVTRILLVLLILAALDYIYQKHQFEVGLRMSKQEVKDEMKQVEGDPQIRARIRNKQRQIAMKRMMASVPKAVVVVTNPIHVAVALRYEEELPAPQLVAKGAGFIAERIKEIAREHKIPIIEKPELARLVFKTVEIGRYIPPTLYQAIAEIIAYVYQLKGVGIR